MTATQVQDNLLSVIVVVAADWFGRDAASSAQVGRTDTRSSLGACGAARRWRQRSRIGVSVPAKELLGDVVLDYVDVLLGVVLGVGLSISALKVIFDKVDGEARSSFYMPIVASVEPDGCKELNSLLSCKG